MNSYIESESSEETDALMIKKEVAKLKDIKEELRIANLSTY